MLKRSRSRRVKRLNHYKSLLALVLVTIISVLGLKWFGQGSVQDVAVADTQVTSQSSTLPSSSPIEVVNLSAKIETSESVPSSSRQIQEPSGSEQAASVSQQVEKTEPVVEEVVHVEEAVAYYTEPVVEETVVYTQTSAPATTSYPVVLSNGNTAGAIGTEAAARMAAATGVPQETWEYIIARESNGDPNVANSSGASGLFQTMPGWGSTATVDDQIDAALNAYNNQGLAAWGF